MCVCECVCVYIPNLDEQELSVPANVFNSSRHRNHGAGTRHDFPSLYIYIYMFSRRRYEVACTYLFMFSGRLHTQHAHDTPSKPNLLPRHLADSETCTQHTKETSPHIIVWCSVWQCGAVYCSVMQRGAVCCSLLHSVTVCVAVCHRMLQCQQTL